MDEVSDITEAIQFFDGLEPEPDADYVFRGHADESWQVIPSIFRDDMGVLQHESSIIRELISLYPNEFEADRTMFDRLVRMQHFGLRTRLMDVTRDPLVGLYFAVEEGPNDPSDGAVVLLSVPHDRKKFYDSDAVSCLANLANLSDDEKNVIEDTRAKTITELHKIHAVDRLYQFIRAEKPEFMPRIKREDLFKPYYAIPKMANKRIIAQNGAFLIFGLKRTKSPKFKRGIYGSMVRIPSAAKPKIRMSLRRLGYDDSTLFPDIERSARQIMRNYAT
jgi:hypothetical protein